MDGESLVKGLTCRRIMWGVIHHRVRNMGGWGMVSQRQVLHVRPHCRLIDGKLIDCSGRHNGILGRRRDGLAGVKEAVYVLSRVLLVVALAAVW